MRASRVAKRAFGLEARVGGGGRPGLEITKSRANHLGFRQCRVRHHDEVARLEIAAAEMGRALSDEIREALVRDLKAIGYRYVSLDLQGYRTGSLNEVLPLRPA